MKWYLMSMCFSRQWELCFLSQTYPLSWFSLIRSVRSCRIQTASCVAPASATYSASALERAIHDCFLLLQLLWRLRCLSERHTLMLIFGRQHLRPSRHLNSQCTHSFLFFHCKVNQYHMIHLTAAQCSSFGSALKRANLLTAYIMLYQVLFS